MVLFVKFSKFKIRPLEYVLKKNASNNQAALATVRYRKYASEESDEILLAKKNWQMKKVIFNARRSSARNTICMYRSNWRFNFIPFYAENYR